MLSSLINRILDWIYPIFSRLMPVRTFKYAACGGASTVISLAVFYFSFNFLFKKQVVHLPLFALEPYIASMFLSFIVSFPLGFYLSRNVVFTGSVLRGRHQLMRYFGSAMGSVLLNYINLKVMVELLHFYPTIAQVVNTVIVIVFSYLMQRHFAFKPAQKST